MVAFVCRQKIASFAGVLFPAPCPEETAFRYLPYLARAKRLLIASQRYIAYSSDVGESLRPVLKNWQARSASRERIRMVSQVEKALASTKMFHLLKSMFCFPLLALKGIHRYWTCFFPLGSGNCKHGICRRVRFVLKVPFVRCHVSGREVLGAHEVYAAVALRV